MSMSQKRGLSLCCSRAVYHSHFDSDCSVTSRSRWTKKPTPRGPAIVQITTAHVMTKNISSPEGSIPGLSRCRKVNVPELCDSDAIKNPISPLLIIAKLTMRAMTCGHLARASWS